MLTNLRRKTCNNQSSRTNLKRRTTTPPRRCIRNRFVCLCLLLLLFRALRCSGAFDEYICVDVIVMLYKLRQHGLSTVHIVSAVYRFGGLRTNIYGVCLNVNHLWVFFVRERCSQQHKAISQMWNGFLHKIVMFFLYYLCVSRLFCCLSLHALLPSALVI